MSESAPLPIDQIFHHGEEATATITSRRDRLQWLVISIMAIAAIIIAFFMWLE